MNTYFVWNCGSVGTISSSGYQTILLVGLKFENFNLFNAFGPLVCVVYWEICWLK